MKKQRIKSRRSMEIRIRNVIRFRYFIAALSFFLIGGIVSFLNLSYPEKASAATESFPSGAYIINMGITPQTYANGLKPYGMVYDLMVNYNVPIKWVIEPTKAKDGTDFTYSTVAYKGGPFVILAEYINATVSARIGYWATQGVSGIYTTSAVNLPVYATITNFPRIIIDTVSKNENIIEAYLANAGFPTTSYEKGSPSLLTNCHDLWVNPHGDPTWSSHGYLNNLVTVSKSYIWSGCHAVSVMEGVKNSASPFEQLNFLSTNGLKCYSSTKCGGSINETHSGNPSGPTTHNFPADPIMQFMGTMSGATNSGSEKWYIPQSTGQWRTTTMRLVTTGDGTTPGEGVLMVYGPAYGNKNNGYVMYEAGHDLDGSGSTADKVAAQRAFFNFALLAGITKQIVINNIIVPSNLKANEVVNVQADASSGTPGYSYKWTSSIGGTFGNSNSRSTSFKAPSVVSTSAGIFTLVVTDGCARKNFITAPFVITPIALPITLKNFSGKSENNEVVLSWITSSEVNNDHFTIEKSSDGMRFETIGQVQGSGNSTHDIKYSLVDPKPGISNNYYRLKQTDYDGKSETFDPIYIKIENIESGNQVIKIFPNPFHGKFTIDYKSELSGIVHFKLYNQSGMVQTSSDYECNKGYNSFDVDNLEGLTSGIYLAILCKEDDKKIIKLFKK